MRRSKQKSGQRLPLPLPVSRVKQPVPQQNPTPKQLGAALLEVIDSGQLRGSTGVLAGRLLAALHAPVRIVVAGASDDLCRQLLLHLLGEDPLPEALPKGHLLLASPLDSARSETGFGLDPAPPGTMQAFVHRLPVPDQQLKGQTILCLRTEAARDARHSSLMQVRDQTDICLWCCGDFDQSEAALWAGAPAQLRVQAFLVSPQPGPAPPGFIAKFAPANALADLAIAVAACAAAGRQARLDHAALFLSRYRPGGTKMPPHPAQDKTTTALAKTEG